MTSGSAKGFGSAVTATVNGASINAKSLNVKNCTLTYTFPSGKNTSEVEITLWALVNSTANSGTCTVTAYNASNAQVGKATLNISKASSTLSGSYTANKTAIVTDAYKITGTLTATDNIAKMTFYLTSGSNIVLAKGSLTYSYVEVSLTQLQAPENVVATYAVVDNVYETTVSFDEVANANGYTVKVYKGENKVYEQENFASGDEIEYYIPGTYTVKVVANGDGASYATSEESVASNEVEIKAVEKTIAEINELLNAGEYSEVHYYRTSGLNTVSENDYYGVTIYDGSSSIVIFGNLKTSAGGSNLVFENVGLVPGDVVTVEGTLTVYGTKNELTNCYYVSKAASVAVGVQTATVEGGAHIRFVGGINLSVEAVQSITLSITCDGQTVTFNIYKVFGSLAANNENGIVEITAASQGFESLFALTITNVPSGKTLEVSATVTTAQGTYTSAVKTVTVE